MAHVLADMRPRFNSYSTTTNTQHAPAPKQYSSYHYTPATPANTPTKSHPSSSYPYRQASNPSHSWLASAPQASFFARPSLCSTLTSTEPKPTLSPSTSTTKTSPAPSRSHAAVSPYPCLRPLSRPCPPSVLCSPTTSVSLAPHSHSQRCPCVPTPACTLVLDPDPNLGLGTNHDYAHPRALSLALELPPLLPSQ
ncbi:hypothetical protein FRC08_001232 [Ceratobasidium sp. 394]|nr:hypothetical protein FRC08_001232 [Ceratobasidium sp. 394]